jgi:lysozyme
MSRVLGIDVSKYQSPTAPAGVAWPEIAKSSRFAFVRATYGTFRDPLAPAHVARARDAGMLVGLYHFFRPIQPVAEQLAAFASAALQAGLRVGDLAPWLDVEDDPNVAQLTPTVAPAVEAALTGMVALFGECCCYITQRDFGRLGKPACVLERPLAVAHYTAAASPATPAGMPWTYWQNRVGPYLAGGPGGFYQPSVLDQDVAAGDEASFPRVGRLPSSGTPPPSGPEPGFSREEQLDLRRRSQQRMDEFVPELYEEMRDDPSNWGGAAIPKELDLAEAKTDPSELAPESEQEPRT